MISHGRIRKKSTFNQAQALWPFSSWWLNQPIWKIWVKMGIFPQFSGWTSKIFELPPLSFGENLSENVTQKLKGFLVTFKLGVPSRLLNRRDVHVGFNFSGDPRSHKKHGKFGHYTTTPQQKPWHLNGGVCQYMSISVKQLNLNWWSECYKIYPPNKKEEFFHVHKRSYKLGSSWKDRCFHFHDGKEHVWE